MEYLTAEEKTLIDLAGRTQLKHISNQIKDCAKFNLDDQYWRELYSKTEIALSKINKQERLEVIEIRKTYQNTVPCKPL